MTEEQRKAIEWAIGMASQHNIHKSPLRELLAAPSAVVLDDERAELTDADLSDLYSFSKGEPRQEWIDHAREFIAARAASPHPVAQPVEQPTHSREDVLKQAAALCDQLAEQFPDGAARLCAKTLRRFNEQLEKKETRQ